MWLTNSHQWETAICSDSQVIWQAPTQHQRQSRGRLITGNCIMTGRHLSTGICEISWYIFGITAGLFLRPCYNFVYTVSSSCSRVIRETNILTTIWKMKAIVGPFYECCLTEIPAWISNHLPGKVWAEITYPIRSLSRLHFTKMTAACGKAVWHDHFYIYCHNFEIRRGGRKGWR